MAVRKSGAQFEGFNELMRAIRRNPASVKKHGLRFMQRASSEYRRGITQTRWNLGGTGGGTPVDEGTLKGSHFPPKVTPTMVRYAPDTDYDEYVHEGTSKMEARPWLDWVADQKERKIRRLHDEMLTDIRNDLAK